MALSAHLLHEAPVPAAFAHQGPA